MKKLLILAIYPAPYRAELFNILSEHFSVDVFFETSGGDDREDKWFSKGNFHLLDKKDGEIEFANAKKHMENYSLVLCYDFTTKTAVKLIANCIFKKIPYVINCDGLMMRPHGNPVFDVIKKILVSRACACLASGENAKRYFLRYGATENRIFIHTFSTLHNGDILSSPPSYTEKNEIREKLGLPNDKFISVAVGRFIPLKRYNELIAEWRNMPENHILLLIGSGSEEDNYRATINNYHLQNVIIEGFHAKNELFQYYKAADMFVHPTSYDVWGLVLNEAFACGLPAVVSDHCVAALELIKDGENGYKVPMGNDKLMCEKILEICSSESVKEKMSKAATRTINGYTVENMAGTHIKVFKELINRDN